MFTANQDQESLTSPIEKSNDSLKLPLAKMETIKCWGVSTYKCTRQLMYEKLGKTSRTVDKGMNLSIAMLLFGTWFPLKLLQH